MPKRKPGAGKKGSKRIVQPEKSHGNKGNLQHEIEDSLSRQVSEKRKIVKADKFQGLIGKLQRGESILTDEDFKRLEINSEASKRSDIEAQELARTYVVM
ncbi:MAG: hypothetical protein HGA31_00545 [Candidatus Moranbacteria bacterium]|nr:hypothetical protein [Candidatus Moranbacteria bacterium]